MSRETNSLLLRYNINKFWSSSLNIAKLQYANFLYEQLLLFVLSNCFLQVLKIQYNLKIINIYVFHFKYDRFNFFYKYLKIKKNFSTKLKNRINYGLIQKIVAPLKTLNKSGTFIFNILLLSLKKIFINIKYQLLANNSYIFFLRKKNISILKKTFTSRVKTSFV